MCTSVLHDEGRRRRYFFARYGVKRGLYRLVAGRLRHVRVPQHGLLQEPDGIRRIGYIVTRPLRVWHQHAVQ